MRPGTPLFCAALAVLAFSSAAYFIPALEDWVSWVWLFPLPFLIADALLLRFFSDTMIITREMNTSCVLGRVERVKLSVRRAEKGKLAGALRIFDLYDDLFECDAFPAPLSPPKNGGEVSFFYEIRPFQRGDWEFSGCDLLISSPFRFWRRKIRHAVVSRGRVYPGFASMPQAALDAVLQYAGDENARKRGAGIEFDHLREWRPGDTSRAVDWRATSRRAKIIIREYIEEQDQHILIALDTGYRLHRQESPGKTQFDAALNAALALAAVACKKGDAVAVSLFGGGERWIPPQRGPHALSTLMNALYDAKSSSSPSSLSSALETALSRLKRRTFIILISNFREEDEEPLSEVLRLAGKRHLLLLAGITENDLDALCDTPGADEEGALVSAAAASYRFARRKLMSRWEERGFLTLESRADALAAPLINRYLAVKRSGRL
jgi:uncharacterized protein (DUF58 family)